MKQPPTINQRSPRRVHTPDANGTRLIIQSRRYQTWRKNIAIERMNRCDVCMNRDGVITTYDQMHHIKPRATHPELVMDPDNVLLLCVAHHDEVHGKETNDTQQSPTIEID